MVHFSLFAKAATLLAVSTSVSALTVPEVKRQVDGVVKVDFERSKPSIQKRSSYTGAAVDFIDDSIYTIVLYVGSSKKPVTVLFDSGSSDIFFPNSDPQDGLGWFDPFTDSQTIKNLSINADVFGHNSDYFTDSVGLSADDQLQNIEFAVSRTTTQGSVSLLGAGFASNEFIVNGYEYDNFPIQLKKQGRTNKAGYSIYFHDTGSNDGSIIFGGVDNAKYEGDLNYFPIVSTSEVRIQADSFVLDNGTSFALSSPALLDTGTSFLVLPDVVRDTIYDIFGAVDSNGYVINYNPEWATSYFTFNIGKTAIKLKYTDLLEYDDSVQKWYRSFIESTDENATGSIIFGDPFFQQAYVVVNFDDNVVGLAQSISNSTSDITPF